MAEGLAGRLIGKPLPDIVLRSTDGTEQSLAEFDSDSILVIYPYTGASGIPDPPGWDLISGAHGSTPQLLAYSRLYEEFHKQGAKIFGLSLQAPAWQRAFVERNSLAFPLLSDERFEVLNALGLPFFVTGGRPYLKRLTLLVRNTRIRAYRYPVTDPAQDAELSLTQWLR